MSRSSIKGKGTGEIAISFKFQEPQTRLLHRVAGGNGKGLYIVLKSPQNLEVGGQRSGKTTGKMMHGIEEYCLRYDRCDMLVLRRTIPELDTIIQDMITFLPEDMYELNRSTRIATFKNGSRIVFAGCVRGGTLIDTARGLIPIENVTTQDLVLTRQGYRKVLWSGQTGIKETIRFDNLWVTPDHHIYCNGEFVSAKEILCQRALGKTANLCIQKSSYLKAQHIVDIPIQKDNGIEITLQDGEGGSNARFMSRFTKVFTEKFQRVLKYITKTKTVSIIPRTILFSSNGVLTESYTNPLFTLPLSNNVWYAENLSALNIQVNELLALNHVEEHLFEDGQRATLPAEPVYDLTIEDQHEYFANGILVHNCANNVERDIEKYLGQAFPYIQVSECAQFSPEVWERLSARNLVNAGCQPDEHGNLPIPRIVGDTNPIGAHWDYYYTKFVKREPWEKLEGMRQDKEGRYWVPEGGEWRCVYDPQDYAFNHTTILDNKEYLKRDPGIIARLNQMTKAKREIFLLGRMDGVSGQYFDCWSEDVHVIDLREDDEAVIWQPWQPVIGGQDWGVGGAGHANAFYLFTRAMVRVSSTAEYKPRVICFKEVSPEGSLTAAEFADLINSACYYPRLPDQNPQYSLVSGQRCKIAAIAFSHEKFSRSMEQHSPADVYSRLLRERGLPPVSRATQDRIGSAGYMYNELKMGRLCILKTCPAIIQAIPSLQRDPKHLDDVLKTSAKGDDRYDAFRYGLFMMFKERGMPEDVKHKIELERMTPWQRHLAKLKYAANQKKRGETFTQKSIPTWMTKL